ncbi:MAG: transposase [Candidatus Aminicenantales bacterium]
MARCARIISFDLPMHVMNRGNNRQPLFTSREEKLYFLSLIHEKKAMNGIHIYHYCLMNNHIHLVVRLEPDGDLSRFLKQVFLAYYCLFRNRHDYVGHLVQGRFKGIVIDTEGYLIQCGKYIELNPVRANIVTDPGDYEFSSYRYYAEGLYDPLITPNPCFAGLAKDEAARQASYRSLFIDNGMVNSAKLRSHLYLGSEAFINRMEMEFGIRNVALKPGRPKKPEKNRNVPIFDSPVLLTKTAETALIIGDEQDNHIDHHRSRSVDVRPGPYRPGGRPGGRGQNAHLPRRGTPR